MRLRIIAKAQRKVFIPFSYQYQLHSCIYRLIEKSSKEYSKFLHDKGFTASNKVFKLFTFSFLKLKPFRICKNGFRDVSEVEFVFSTLVDKSLEHLVVGIFKEQKITLQFFGDNRVEFDVTLVETLPKPAFSEKMKFICLSPIVSSTKKKMDGEWKLHYLEYDKESDRAHFEINIRQNLLKKYEAFYGKPFDKDFEFSFRFDENYIKKHKGKIYKLIDFKGLKIKGILAPFEIEAPKELIEVGWEAGFGEKCSGGFGMGKV